MITLNFLQKRKKMTVTNQEARVEVEAEVEVKRDTEKTEIVERRSATKKRKEKSTITI